MTLSYFGENSTAGDEVNASVHLLTELERYIT